MDAERETRMRWAAASLVLAVVAGAVLLFAPLGTVTGGAPGSAEGVRHPSLVGFQGWGVAIPLALPAAVAAVALAAIPRFGRRAAVAGTVALALSVVLSALSMWPSFAPSVVAMVLAAAGRRRRPVGTLA